MAVEKKLVLKNVEQHYSSEVDKLEKYIDDILINYKTSIKPRVSIDVSKFSEGAIEIIMQRYPSWKIECINSYQQGGLTCYYPLRIYSLIFS